jgi:hypothetical protein
MKHEIECCLNAIECARENYRDANIELNSSIQIYDVANMYIDDDVITCNCVEKLMKRVENELRVLYTNIHNFEFKYERVAQTTMFHIIFAFDEFISNETFRYVETMIIETNDITKYNSNFTNFRQLTNLYV